MAMPFSKKFKTQLRPNQKSGFGNYPILDIPLEIGDGLLGDQNMLRVIIHFDNGIKLHRALKRNKDGETLITLGKSTLKDAKKEMGEIIEIWLEKDETEFGYEMPEELAEVMLQDPEGDKAFRNLKPGMQRSFLHYIVSAKTVDTRIKRSLQLIENLKVGILSAGPPK